MTISHIGHPNETLFDRLTDENACRIWTNSFITHKLENLNALDEDKISWKMISKETGSQILVWPETETNKKSLFILDGIQEIKVKSISKEE